MGGKAGATHPTHFLPACGFRGACSAASAGSFLLAGPQGPVPPRPHRKALSPEPQPPSHTSWPSDASQATGTCSFFPLALPPHLTTPASPSQACHLPGAAPEDPTSWLPANLEPCLGPSLLPHVPAQPAPLPLSPGLDHRGASLLHRSCCPLHPSPAQEAHVPDHQNPPLASHCS